MQQEIRFTLFIIGIAIIGGVLLHGIWTIRKNAKKTKRTSFESQNWEPGFDHEDDIESDNPYYDDVGVSKARVVVNPVSSAPKTQADSVDSADLASMNESEIETEQTDRLYTEDVNLAEAVSSDSLDTVNVSSGDATQDAEQQIVDNVEINTDDSLKEVTGFDEEQTPEDTPKVSAAPMYSNVVTQPKPEFTRHVNHSDSGVDNIGTPPEFLLKKNDMQVDATEHQAIDANTSALNDTQSGMNNISNYSSEQASAEQVSQTTIDVNKTNEDFSLDVQSGPSEKPLDAPKKKGVEKELSFAQQAKRFVTRGRKSSNDKKRKEPVIKHTQEDQMLIDFDTADQTKEKKVVTETQLSFIDDYESDTTEQVNSTSSTENNDKAAYTGEPEVLVLNVRAANDKPIEGAALLPMLLTLGFKFGEHDIFHRHVNTNGTGPILFSLTNMLKPGVFDIDNIENFSTLGVSLFMMLPTEGDAQQVFNMMHNAARKLSEEFDCRILDANKVALSKQSLQQYIERIREFERKRMSR